MTPWLCIEPVYGSTLIVPFLMPSMAASAAALTAGGRSYCGLNAIFRPSFARGSVQPSPPGPPAPRRGGPGRAVRPGGFAALRLCWLPRDARDGAGAGLGDFDVRIGGL